jgi:hypothetical protein
MKPLRFYYTLEVKGDTHHVCAKALLFGRFSVGWQTGVSRE